MLEPAGLLLHLDPLVEQETGADVQRIVVQEDADARLELWSCYKTPAVAAGNPKMTDGHRHRSVYRGEQVVYQP
jgi:hypothetical protein